MYHTELAGKVVRRTLWTGGISIDLDGREPTEGYMVSVHGSEVIVQKEEFNEDTVRNYIALFKNHIGYGSYLGTWVDGEEVYLDVSVNFHSLSEAIKLGRENNQKAIYSLNTNKVVPL